MTIQELPVGPEASIDKESCQEQHDITKAVADYLEQRKQLKNLIISCLPAIQSSPPHL